jgi:hypothetical protein
MTETRKLAAILAADVVGYLPSPAHRCPCCGGLMIIVETFVPLESFSPRFLAEVLLYSFPQVEGI